MSRTRCRAGNPIEWIAVSETIEVLVLDLLEWLYVRERTYEETMDAWRTSCPKLPVWEDANDRGLLHIEHRDGRASVRLTPAGWQLLRRRRPTACPTAESRTA